ncbi:MAG: methionyl-tRNA formyltransferase [Anaerolineales bacterium]
MPARLVFMGSPDFSLAALRALAAAYPVVGVVTQPDRPSGRGQQLSPPPVKLLALELGIPVIQPTRLRGLPSKTSPGLEAPLARSAGEGEGVRGPQALEQLRAWAPDLIVVAAFGQILRQEVLDLPPHGCINVHASLLPRWRGASPIQAAILHGDAETGVTIMRMDAGLDTGPILSRRAIPIAPDDTAASLSEKLATLGADLLMESLPAYLSGELLPSPQPQEGVTTASTLTKRDGLLETNLVADVLARKVRAYNPWPGAFVMWKGQPLKVHRAHVASGPSSPGAHSVIGGLPALGTAFRLLVLDEVQPAGKTAMSGAEFLRGARSWSD